ncbi:TetR/AcrR family transcriptional regulator [Aquabacterium lacunae]|uniref:TetR/AcrR family transcriptional regulator n=1 Tax=Aquabacterium lacunae TaxID=2528630 RepID=A0A4Q9GVI0_9BURK|nr:TetR/AcrR family transcriptional regulator [Aquabacterium lacunae]
MAVESEYALLTFTRSGTMPRTPPEPASVPARTYHHGNLRRAIMDTALQLAEEQGDDQINLREVARRLSVSPSAPFRHFTTQRALVTALAEEATLKLRLLARRELQRAPAEGVEPLRALARAFVAWALDEPAAFRLTSRRNLSDFERSASAMVHFKEMRDLTVSLVEAAQARHALPKAPPQRMALLLRASAYGLVRMHLDGQLQQWLPSGSVPTQPDPLRREVLAALDLLLDAFQAPASDPQPVGRAARAKPLSPSRPRP